MPTTRARITEVLRRGGHVREVDEMRVAWTALALTPQAY